MLLRKLFLLSDEVFHLVYVVWYTLFTEESATFFCNEDVIFYSDSAKVFIGFQQVIIDEILMQPLLTPVVNERGDEVNARFVTHHPTFLQSASASQTVGSELLQVRTHFVIKSNVDLS